MRLENIRVMYFWIAGLFIGANSASSTHGTSTSYSSSRRSERSEQASHLNMAIALSLLSFGILSKIRSYTLDNFCGRLSKASLTFLSLSDGFILDNKRVNSSRWQSTNRNLEVALEGVKLKTRS